MAEDMGSQVAVEVAGLVETGKAIVFGTNIPDNKYSEIMWSQYGLIETNEIAVIVKCGSKAFGAWAQSKLIVPAMKERIYGMDALDEALAFELGEKLWTAFSDELFLEVRQICESG